MAAGSAGVSMDLLSQASRWLLVVGAALVPLIFDPLDPGRTLLEAKRTAVWAVGGLVIVLWALRWLLHRRIPEGLGRDLVLPFSVLAVVLAVATWQAPNPFVAFWGSRVRGEGLLTIMCYLVVALAASCELRNDPGFQRRLVAALLIGATGNALYALVQFAGHDPVWGFRGYLRPFAMQGNAALLAGYLAMMLPVGAAAAIGAANRLARLAMVALVGLLFLGLLVTTSRVAWAASWVGIGLVGAAAVARGGRSQHRQVAAIAVVMAALTVLVGAEVGPFSRTIDQQVLARVAAAGQTLRLVPGEVHPDARPLTQRLAMTFEYGGGVPVRLTVWQGAVSAWMRRPWFGQGLDSFRYFPNLSDPREARLYAGKTLPPLFRYDRVHNEFLEMAVAAGIVGLFAYLWWLGTLLVPAVRSTTAGDLMAAGAAAGAIAFLLVLQVQPGYLGSSFVFWTLLGFGFARARSGAAGRPIPTG